VRPPPRFLAPALLTALWLALPAVADTKRVHVPLVIPPDFLERLLIEQVFTDPERTAHVVAVADPCSEIVLSQPSVRPRDGGVGVHAHGVAQAGFTFLGTCYQPFGWEGEVDALEQVRLAHGAPMVEFHVVDSSLSGGGGWLGFPELWNWIKPSVHPRLEVLRVDLGPLIGDLRRTLPLFTSHPDEPELRRLVDSLALSSVDVEERGLVLGVSFDVEALPLAQSASAEEPPLAPEELAAFEAQIHEWDAFVTFVVKSVGNETLDPQLRSALLEALIAARYDIVAALGEPGRDGPDRVRALFQSSWQRLQPTIATLTHGGEGFRYLAFLAAGDALFALDQAGPAFGFEISSDGLRRLARTLEPAASEDPLQWSNDVDPTLRATFGFDEELPKVVPPPEDADLSDEPTDDLGADADSSATPDEEPEPEPTPLAPEVVPPLTPEPEPAPLAPEPGTSLRSLGAVFAHLATLLWPPAFAAPAIVVPTPETSPLDALVPTRDDLDEYLPKIGELLRDSAKQVLSHGKLPREYHDEYQRLVLATAWQESCWRQYVQRKQKRVPLRSSVGALGLMQVNPRVWRGFFSVDGLSWSIRYNAVAGGEVLLHYLRDYALARGEDAFGDADGLVRATYATYHGGPSHMRRYRETKGVRAVLTKIDKAFLSKYKTLAGGDVQVIRQCFTG
jgi:hypothetical protein